MYVTKEVCKWRELWVLRIVRVYTYLSRTCVPVRRRGRDAVSYSVGWLVIRQTVVFIVGSFDLKGWSAQCLDVASSRQKTYGVVIEERERERSSTRLVLPSAAANNLSTCCPEAWRTPHAIACCSVVSFRLWRPLCVCMLCVQVESRTLVTLRYPGGFGRRLETWSSFVDDRPEVTCKCIPLKPRVHYSSSPAVSEPKWNGLFLFWWQTARCFVAANGKAYFFLLVCLPVRCPNPRNFITKKWD